MHVKLIRHDLVHPELSYKIIGVCYDVYNELGFVHKEKYYQKAFEIEFKNRKVPFRSQVRTNLIFRGTTIGWYIFDFIVDEKIVVELKVGSRFKKQDYKQVKNYLLQSGYMLGLLVRFDESGVTFSRVLQPIFVDS